MLVVVASGLVSLCFCLCSGHFGLATETFPLGRHGKRWNGRLDVVGSAAAAATGVWRINCSGSGLIPGVRHGGGVGSSGGCGGGSVVCCQVVDFVDFVFSDFVFEESEFVIENYF